MKKSKGTIYRSIHTDYLQFAFDSFLECKTRQSLRPYVNRSVIETIRYSYDCLEASVEFIYDSGERKQLPIDIPDNWLIRYMKRQWKALSLSDKLGVLSFAYKKEQSFWQYEQQYQLFEDLRILRDGLTHPKPLGTEIFEDSEVLEFKEPSFLVHRKPLAKFHKTPELLDKSDAEKAVEIMLHHLNRIQDLFYPYGRSTFFGYWDKTQKIGLSTDQLLEKIDCKFTQYWNNNKP